MIDSDSFGSNFSEINGLLPDGVSVLAERVL
jgi:hypothetical protein